MALSLVVVIAATVVVGVRAGWFRAEVAATAVTEHGVDVMIGGIHVRGSADVAPAGTPLTASPVTADPPAELAKLVTGLGSGVDVSLAGRQPGSPLELRFPVAGSPPQGGHAVVLTVPSDGSGAYFLPATYDKSANMIVATTGHLSGFWPAFVDFGKLSQWMGDVIGGTVLQKTARPDCTGAPATGPAGVTATIEDVDADPPLWPCLAFNGGELTVNLTANSPLPWRTRAAPDARLDPQGAVDPHKAFLIAAYQTLIKNRPYVEGLLIPGTSLTYRFGKPAEKITVAAQADVGTWLAMDLMFAVQSVMTLFHVDSAKLQALADNADVIACLGDAAEAAKVGSKPSAETVTSLAKAVIGCIEPAVKALGGELAAAAGFALLVLSSGAGLVFGGLQGVVLSVTGKDTVTYSVRVNKPAVKVDPASYRMPYGGYSFNSPSGRLLCGVVPPLAPDVAMAGCQGETKPVPPRPADCNRDIGWGRGMYVDDTGRVDFICAGGLMFSDGNSKVLPYGSSLSVLGMTCTSAETGMRCVHDRTGHGFRIASGSNERF